MTRHVLPFQKNLVINICGLVMNNMDASEMKNG